ncbi:MAG: hypothetical protein JXA82_14065 [Sedimentisphaerales bacterium]|nr:hypothetical protein [Sedimentisphaerales bacterium]
MTVDGHDGGIGAFALSFQPRLLIPLHLRGYYGYLNRIDKELKDRGFQGRFWTVKGLGDTLDFSEIMKGM